MMTLETSPSRYQTARSVAPNDEEAGATHLGALARPRSPGPPRSRRFPLAFRQPLQALAGFPAQPPRPGPAGNLLKERPGRRRRHEFEHFQRPQGTQLVAPGQVVVEGLE